MKQSTSQKTQFLKILRLLSKQNGQEKLRIAFTLSEFVRQLRTQGNMYAKKKQLTHTRTTA